MRCRKIFEVPLFYSKGWFNTPSDLRPELCSGSNNATFTKIWYVAVNRVNELSGQNRDNIDVLAREVSRFKVE